MSASLLEEQDLVSESAVQPEPEQLLERAEGHRYELIDGKLVERHMGAKSSAVASRLNRLVGNHADAHKLGEVFGPDAGYQIFPPEDTKRVRFADLSFIQGSRLPDAQVPEGHLRIFPDLAVEVVSLNDTAEEIEARRVAFLRAGTRLFWIIYPGSRTVHVFHPDGTARALSEGDELSGEDVLPGFTCKVAAFFEGL
jgi:Uma2 family endonuclease